MDKTQLDEHESYGMINISKFNGGNNVYFGSSIEHDGGVSLTISTGKVIRNLSTDWYSSNKEIIRIEMSHSQFVDAISSGMNTSGVPCTIKYINGKKKDNPPFNSKRLQFENEFKEKANNIAKMMDESLILLKQLQSKNGATKEDKIKIYNKIASVKQELGSNIGFLGKCFNEQMDKTVIEAKLEVDGFIESKIREFGIESLKTLNNINICKIKEINND